MTEHEHQVALCKWLTLRGVGFFSVPNGAILGGARKFAQLAKLRKEGFRNGAPDLVLTDMADDLRPVAVEMKSIDGRLSDEQKSLHQELREHDWHVVVGYGFEDAKTKLEGLGF